MNVVASTFLYSKNPPSVPRITVLRACLPAERRLFIASIFRMHPPPPLPVARPDAPRPRADAACNRHLFICVRQCFPKTPPLLKVDGVGRCEFT